MVENILTFIVIVVCFVAIASQSIMLMRCKGKLRRLLKEKSQQS